MPTNHVTKQIEAYLENRLSAEERQLVENHLAQCPACAYRLYNARRITHELGPILKKTLGQPLPPPALQHRVRQALSTQQGSRRLHFSWALSGRIINAVGTLAVVGVLSFSVLTIIQSQTTVDPSETGTKPARFSANEGRATVLIPTPTASASALEIAPPPSTPASNSLKETVDLSADDSVSHPVSAVSELANREIAEPESSPMANNTWQQPAEEDAGEVELATLPAGTVAFTFFNAGSNVYEINLIAADGTNRQRFPLDGVSEPALSRAQNGEYLLAYRAWGEPTTPRALLVNNISADQPTALTNFWEDAQPDWSPTEPRLIFASQRESDRRWRLYTIWHDGSAEKDLRREGKSPSFAPDGLRFVFEGCDEVMRDQQCGLWLGDLENSEHDSQPFLLNERAQAPDWSPVGEEIVYMASSGNNWDIYLTDSSGRTPRRLTTDPAADGLPVWSPDGQWLAFLSNRDNHWGIWLMAVDSLEIKPLVILDEGHFEPPQRPPYEERHWWDEQLSWSN